MNCNIEISTAPNTDPSLNDVFDKVKNLAYGRFVSITTQLHQNTKIEVIFCREKDIWVLAIPGYGCIIAPLSILTKRNLNGYEIIAQGVGDAIVVCKIMTLTYILHFIASREAMNKEHIAGPTIKPKRTCHLQTK